MAQVYLFVYGTLLAGCRDPFIDRVITDCCRFCGQGFIQARLYDLGEYPGAVVSPRRQDRVYGEVWEVLQPGECFRVLDDYEEYLPHDAESSEFVRSRVVVCLPGKKATLECWAYMYNKYSGEHCNKRISSGDWRLHTASAINNRERK